MTDGKIVGDLNALNAVEAEMVVLGCVLRDPGCMEFIADKLTGESFSLLNHTIVWQTMLHLWSEQTPPDFVNVVEALEQDGTIDGPTMLAADLLRAVDHAEAIPAYVWSYANIVQRRHQIRLLSDAYGEMLGSLLADPNQSPVDAVAALAAKIDASTGVADDPGPRSADTLLPLVLDTIMDRRAGIIQPDEIPSPWTTLNAPLGGGFKPGSTCVVAARPSMGKTLFAGGLLVEAARYGQAIMFSAEMSYDSVLERAISMVSAVPYSTLHAGVDLTDEQFTTVVTAAEDLASLPIFVDDRAGITTGQIRSRIARLQAQGPVSLVIFDYLELAGDDPDAKNVEQRLSKIITALSTIGKQLGVAMVVLAQLSREVERRNPPIPKLADLRYSGAIEQVADQVLMLYRPEYYVEQGQLDPDPSYAGRCEVYIHKNRNGEKGMVPLQYHAPIFRLTDMLRPF